MKLLCRIFLFTAGTLLLNSLCYAGSAAVASQRPAPSGNVYLAAVQDLGFPRLNAVSFYQVQDTQLNFQTTLETGGYGIQGGFYAAQRVISTPSLSASCIYVSNAASHSIGAISLDNLQLVDVFSASDTDDGSSNGIGMAVNANFLYASFTTSGTIGTFALNSGCGLTFLGSIPAVGLQGGPVAGMAVNGQLLVVAYGDGSIQSFNVTGGIPVPNNDLMNSNGYGGAAIIAPNATGNMPSGVDITQDGRFAIFGDISAATTLEVAGLEGGRLGKTKVYRVGESTDAGFVRLSPDQSMVFIANSEGGTVTAAFFDPSTGVIRPGCTSPTLRGFNGRPWLGSIATRDTSGTGGLVYVAEFGRDHLEINHGPSSEVGILAISSNGSSCTLTETDTSPVSLGGPGALSIGVYPPRPF